MISANKDPEYKIKEKDKYYWHVLQTRITLDKNNPKVQVRDSFVQIYDTANFNFIFRPERVGGKLLVNFRNSCLIDEARVIHDPELVVDEPISTKDVDYRVVPPAQTIPTSPTPRTRKNSK
jgi:hypothetical protein